MSAVACTILPTAAYRRRMKRPALTIALLALCATAAAASSKDAIDLSPNPQWCRAGYRCLSLKDFAAMTLLKVQLEDQIGVLKSKRHLLGLHLTCGLGVAGIVDADYNARLLPAGYCGVGYGW